MVTDNHYRWDFIQLADDPKPTPATSFKVTDGSTLYTSDDSKLYVWYKDQWYEKSATGGGGGIPTTVIDTIWFGTQEEYDLIDPKAEKTLYLIQEEVANTLSESPAVLTLPKINLRDNILIHDATPEEEIEEPQLVEEPQEEEIEEVKEPEVEEENLSEEPQEEEAEEVEKPEVEEQELEEQETVEEPEEEENIESEE